MLNMFARILLYCLSLSLVACGGGGSVVSVPDGVSIALSGVVAVGAPLSHGQVHLRQANGTVTTVPLQASGQWSADLSQSLSHPVILKADGWVGGEKLELYSVLTENTTHVNLTPATDAIVRTLVDIVELESYLNSGTGEAVVALTPQVISNAQAALRETLAPVLQKLSLPSSVNFFTDAMVANGTGLDALYDFVKFRVVPKDNAQVINLRTIYDANWTEVDPSVTSDEISLGELYDAALYTQISQLVQKFLVLNQAQPLNFNAIAQLFHSDFLENGYGKNRYLDTPNYRPRIASFIDVVVTSCNAAVLGVVCDVKLGIQQGAEIRSWITQVISTGSNFQFYGNRRGGVVPLDQLGTIVDTFGSTLTYSVPKVYLTSTVMPFDTETYIPGQFMLEANGFVAAVTASMSIKGRGNHTWGQPKKPYTIKFNTPQSLFGLTAAKNWVLLASYSDDSLMNNVGTMQVARLMGMSFVNNMHPIELWFNGEYQGYYLITEKVEINPGRVDLKSGYLLEISNEYDESEKWRSNRFKNRLSDGLPIMVSDRGSGAKVKDISLTTIQSEFDALEEAILAYQPPYTAGDRNALGNVLDLDSTAQYLAVMLMASNLEINHPKSVKLYKDKGKKFFFGPPWDFDLAMRSFGALPIDFPLDLKSSFDLSFFELLRRHPDVKSRMCDAFDRFKNNMILMDEYVNAYAYTIKDVYVRNLDAWHSTGIPTAREKSVFNYLPKLKIYYRGRCDYLIKKYQCI